MQLRLFGITFPREQVAQTVVDADYDNNMDASIAYRKAYHKNLATMEVAANNADSFLYQCAARQAERNHAKWQQYGGY